MQYFAAFLFILFWMVNKLQCSDRVNNTIDNFLVTFNVTPTPVELTPNDSIVYGKEAEPLNLTCQISYKNTERNDIPSSNNIPPPIYRVDWKSVPPIDNRNHISTRTRIERGQSKNSTWLWFESLAEADAGDYSCYTTLWTSEERSKKIRLSVINKAGTCGTKWFRCHSSRCIRREYLCDGVADCQDGEDESKYAGCALDPCMGKIFCGARCMTQASCCDRGHCNASSSVARLDPGVISEEHQRFNEMGFLQMTIYTVIGCAMAFMFIITILVIMICRVHMKRAMNSRLPQQIRTPGPRPRHSVPLYDLDVYLNRTADINSQGGFTVTYNINNGVQFVGRPVEPPPYSEIAPVPPREGPPPPYVSQENLLDSPIVGNAVTNVLRLSGRNGVGTATTTTTAGGQSVSSGETAASLSRTSPPRAYQTSQNPSIAQCFTSGQIPGPQATPGFNRFNMSLISDDASNTTSFNTSTGSAAALNSSSNNSDSSSNDSVGNFGICRNITSHSQNFEPEYTETDSLLTENRRDDGENRTGFEEKFEDGLRNGCAAAAVPEVSNRGVNLSSKNCQIESPSLMDLEFDRCLNFSDVNRVNDDPTIEKPSNSLSRSKESDSALQRLSSKTVLDLSTVGESSDNNLTNKKINKSIKLGKSLPFYLNLNNDNDVVVENIDRSGIVIVNRDIINTGDQSKIDDVLKITEPISSSGDLKKYSRISSVNNKDTKSPCTSFEEAAAADRDDNRSKDLAIYNSNKNHNKEERILPKVYLDVKDDDIIRVPLVDVSQDNSIGYNNLLSGNINARDLADDEAKSDARSNESQPLVMPLRESFIGLQKDE